MTVLLSLATYFLAYSNGAIATSLGFPVSTTHALRGALIGAGLIASLGISKE